MTKITKVASTLFQDENGQNQMEYGIVVGLMAIGCIMGATGIAAKTVTCFSMVVHTIENALTAA